MGSAVESITTSEPEEQMRAKKRKWTMLALALTGLGCGDSQELIDRAEAAQKTSGAPLQYGTPRKVGNGNARTYVVRDRTRGVPIEIGVALDEAALEGLPANGSLGGGGHEHYDSYLLALPARHGTPYRFVELNWNPKGHGGPYTAPHFDFHFYRISMAEREAINPADTVRAANLPSADHLPAGYASSHVLMGLTPAQASVPKMGLHWLDLSSPELPPGNKPFTATFIVGSWDGRIIFEEPMVTRDFILAQRETGSPAQGTFAVPMARRYEPAGRYPSGYRVSYDRETGEYRIALTGLTPGQ
jgi:hypothetical protein